MIEMTEKTTDYTLSDKCDLEVKFPLANRDAFAQRVILLIKEAGSASELARKCGVSESVVRKWAGGRSDPSRLNLLSLAEGTQSEFKWLVTGEGPQKAPDARPQEAVQSAHKTLSDIEDSLAELIDSAEVEVEEYGGTMAVLDEVLVERVKSGARELYDEILQLAANRPAPADEFALVTVYDVHASAGHGASVEHEQPISELAFRLDWLKKEGLNAKTLAAITAAGDSMEPTIYDGALLLIDKDQRQVSGDAIYVLRLDGHLYAKRLQRLHDGSVRISSDNQAYADERVDRDHARDLDIIGQVVWVGHRM